MNRVFKTKWSVAHQEYVVHRRKAHDQDQGCQERRGFGCSCHDARLQVLLRLLLLTQALSQTIPSCSNRPSSRLKRLNIRRTGGLSAMKASSAYALGYHGQRVKVGMMDSGFLRLIRNFLVIVGTPSRQRAPTLRVANVILSTHTAPIKGSRQIITRATGSLWTGAFDPTINDNHGTGCAGVYAGNRDGVGMHGVAWGSEFYSANTGGTDDTNYGPLP